MAKPRKAWMHRHRVLTIEVNPVTRSLCQIRGKCNRRESEGERRVLDVWASEQRLRIDDNL